MKKRTKYLSKPKDIPNNRTNGDSISKSSHSNSILIFTLAVGIITFTYYFARSSISKTKKGNSSDHKSTDDKNLNSSIDEVASQLTKLSKIKFSDPVQDNWIVASPNNIVDSVYVDNDPNKLKFAIADAVASRKPIQIKNYSSIRETWPIFNWDLLQIAREKNISLNGTRWKPDDPIFVLGHEREKGGMISSPRDHPLLYTNLTLFKFLKATFQPKNWLYWTGELASIEEQLQANATTSENADDMTDDGWRSFRILEKGISDGGKENAQLWNPMLWLSHPGVIAQTHYDTQHNFFIQIHGTKRFLIFPPSEELFQYPNIHRSYRQSQLHFEEKNDISRKLAFFSSQSGNSTEGSVVTEDSPTAAMNPLTYPVMEGKAEAIELLLHPGDILYIPPYWQHRVESLTLALSLSVLSPSHLEASLAEIYWESVPFGEFRTSKGTRAGAVILYLSLLVEELNKKAVIFESLQEIARQHYFTRFQLLPSSAKEKTYECPRLNSSKLEAFELLKVEKLSNFQDAVSRLGQLFVEVEAETSIKVNFLRDYIEQIVRWAVGPKDTGGFIYKCLL